MIALFIAFHFLFNEKKNLKFAYSQIQVMLWNTNMRQTYNPMMEKQNWQISLIDKFQGIINFPHIDKFPDNDEFLAVMLVKLLKMQHYPTYLIYSSKIMQSVRSINIERDGRRTARVCEHTKAAFNIACSQLFDRYHERQLSYAQAETKIAWGNWICYWAPRMPIIEEMMLERKKKGGMKLKN